MLNKKATVILSAMTAISLLAGCASKSDTNSNQPNDAPQGPVKISVLANLQTTSVPSDKLEKVLEQKTNSELDIQWVPDGTYEEKFQASFATGTLPQVVYLKNSAS